MTCITHYFKK